MNTLRLSETKTYDDDDDDDDDTNDNDDANDNNCLFTIQLF